MVVLFTDGKDNMSWLSPEQVLRVAAECEALVQVVAIDAVRDDPRTEPPQLKALRRLADATGGRLWPAGSSRELERTFLRILAEMQSRYLLSYEPTEVAREGWHRLEVKVRGRRGTVRSRPGYFVPPRAGVPDLLEVGPGSSAGCRSWTETCGQRMSRSARRETGTIRGSSTVACSSIVTKTPKGAL